MSARPCPVCGRPVPGPDERRVYCSLVCQNAADYARHAEQRRAERPARAAARGQDGATGAGPSRPPGRPGAV